MADEEDIREKEEFTQQALEEIWNEFVEKYRQENKAALVAMLTSNTPVKEENSRVIFHLSHKAQEIMLDEIRMEMTQFLRKKLRNRDIMVQAEIKVNENARKPFSAQEKFEQLAKENPDLLTFKNRFNLDLDF